MRRLASIAFVTLTLGVTTACSQGLEHEPVGSALKVNDSYTIGTTVQAGHWAAITCPTLVNLTDQPVHVTAVSLASVPDGLKADAIVVHNANDTGGVPLSWSQDVDPNSAGNPVVQPTFPLAAVVVPPKDLGDYFIMLPGTYAVSDVTVTYTLGDAPDSYSQTLPVTFNVKAT